MKNGIKKVSAIAVASILLATTMLMIVQPASAGSTDYLDFSVTSALSISDKNGLAKNVFGKGQPFSVSSYVYLKSTDPVPDSVVVRLLIDGVKYNDKSLVLTKSTQTLVKWTGVTISSSGPHTIMVWINPDKAIFEYLSRGGDAYANNKKSSSVTIIAPAPTAQWTVLAYLDGDNDLEEFALSTFMDLSALGSSSSFNIIAQVDRIAGGPTSYGDWTQTCRFYVTQGMTPILSNNWNVWTYQEVDSSSGAQFSSFLTDAAYYYPADRYLVLLVDHGCDWMGACQDITTGTSGLMTLSGISLGLSDLKAAIGKKVDIVMFDACSMGSIEVAAEIDSYASYMVADPERMLISDWPLNVVDNPDTEQGMIEIVKKYPTVTTEVAVQNIVSKSNVDDYAMGLHVTVGMDLSKVASLVSDLNWWGYYMYGDLAGFPDQQGAHIREMREQQSMIKYEISGPIGGDYREIIDLWYFAQKIKDCWFAHGWTSSVVYTYASNIVAAFGVGSGKLKVAMKSDTDYSIDAGGISIYHPRVKIGLVTEGVFDPAYLTSGSFAKVGGEAPNWGNAYLKKYVGLI